MTSVGLLVLSQRVMRCFKYLVFSCRYADTGAQGLPPPSLISTGPGRLSNTLLYSLCDS